MYGPVKIFFLWLKRLLNIVLLGSSYFISILIKRPVVWGYPTAISIEPTNRCNLRCPECATGNKSLKRKIGDIDYQTFKKVIDETYPYLTSIILYFQGEPFLHPQLAALIKYASDKHIYTMLSTNGHFLSAEKCRAIIEAKLDKIIVSVDGTDEETYSVYRKGGNFPKVIKGISNMVSLKTELKSKIPVIDIQFILMKHNEHQVNAIKKLTKDLGANKALIKTAQITDFEKNGDLLPSQDKHARYRSFGRDEYRIKGKMKNKCLRIWQSLVVLHDGGVVPCCFDKDADHSIGDVSGNSVIEIWKNNAFQNFRKKVLTNRKEIQICTNCTEGLERIYL